MLDAAAVADRTAIIAVWDFRRALHTAVLSTSASRRPAVVRKVPVVVGLTFRCLKLMMP